jgi:tetratricopeptide (TPR) repeat protein
MKPSKLLIGSFLLIVLIGLIVAWVVRRQKAVPEPPEVHLACLDEPMAEAIRNAQDTVRREPHSAKAWGKLAMILAANGFASSAVECYQHAEQLDPLNPSWPYLRGLALSENGAPLDAIPLFHKALDLTRSNEHRAAILFRLAWILIEDGQLDQAERTLQELNQLDQNDSRVHYGLGLLAANRGDQKTAREHLSKLTDVPFARKHASALLATLSAADPEQSRKFHEQVKELPDDQPWPDPFESAMRQFQVDRMSRIAEYTKLSNEGRRREAIRFLQSFVAESPDAEVCALLAFDLFDDGQFESAEKMLRQSLSFDPKNVKAHLLLGLTLYRRGEKFLAEADGKDRARNFFEEAVAEEDKVLVLQPDLGRSLALRGLALHQLGRVDEAVGSLRKAVLADPDVAETHMDLGEILAEMGQFPEALEHLQHAVQLASPDDERPHRTLEKWQARAREPPK